MNKYVILKVFKWNPQATNYTCIESTLSAEEIQTILDTELFKLQGKEIEQSRFPCTAVLSFPKGDIYISSNVIEAIVMPLDRWVDSRMNAIDTPTKIVYK